jgi:hypothetical protein
MPVSKAFVRSTSSETPLGDIGCVAVGANEMVSFPAAKLFGGNDDTVATPL